MCFTMEAVNVHVVRILNKCQRNFGLLASSIMIIHWDWSVGPTVNGRGVGLVNNVRQLQLQLQLLTLWNKCLYQGFVSAATTD